MNILILSRTTGSTDTMVAEDELGVSDDLIVAKDS